MDKLQQYTITFSEPQISEDLVIDELKNALPSDVIDLYRQGLANGSMAFDLSSEVLSADGLTFVVQRVMTENLYNSIMALTTKEQLVTAIETIPHVSNVELEFSDYELGSP